MQGTIGDFESKHNVDIFGIEGKFFYEAGLYGSRLIVCSKQQKEFADLPTAPATWPIIPAEFVRSVFEQNKTLKYLSIGGEYVSLHDLYRGKIFIICQIRQR